MFGTHRFKILLTVTLAFFVAWVIGRVSAAILEEDVAAVKPSAGDTAMVEPETHATASKSTSAEPRSEKATSQKKVATTTPIAKTKVSQGAKKAAFATRSAASKRWKQVTISGNTLRVSRADFNHLTTKGLAPILQSARMDPVVQDGKVRGFRLIKMSPGSIWEAAGLQKNDLFTAVNGLPLNDVRQAVRILQNSKRASTIQVEFTRGNQMHRKVIEIR